MNTHKPFVVVVGTDYSAAAARAIRSAAEQAVAGAPAELHVVHVAPAATHDIEALAEAALVRVEDLEQQRPLLEQHVRESLPNNYLPPTVGLFLHLIVDSPSLGLSRICSELAANLLVVGTHGRRGVVRWLLGSVAEGVVRQAPCPTLIIPPLPAELVVPTIEPPCPECLRTRAASANERYWCPQHSERHGRRHTYHQSDRTGAEDNFPLVAH
ncbi:MAG TPA: universal stress protein [Polyangiaceae bacterium]